MIFLTNCKGSKAVFFLRPILVLGLILLAQCSGSSKSNGASDFEDTAGTDTTADTGGAADTASENPQSPDSSGSDSGAATTSDDTGAATGTSTGGGGSDGSGSSSDDSGVDSSGTTGDVVTTPSLSGKIAVGYSHACAIRSGFATTCWGSNNNDALGDGTTTDSMLPVEVSGLDASVAVDKIVTGYHHTCALLNDGTVKCWGENTYAQLAADSSVDLSSIPLEVSGLSDVQDIASGDYFTCALLSSGVVKCWGENDSDILGVDPGDVSTSSTPLTISGFTGTPAAIAAGVDHACVLMTSGAVQCWGSGGNGQLGNGSTDLSATPVSVSLSLAATSIAAGGQSSCAVLSDHTINCWGSNMSSQLGDGTTDDAPLPVAVSGIADADAVAITTDHACALRGSSVSCWGDGSLGELGDGSYSGSSVPTANIAGLTTATAIAVGENNSCALTSDGNASCWGGNVYGQLGVGGAISSTIPIDVDFGVATENSNFLSVSVGDNFSCASNGSLYCWGDADKGMLGDSIVDDSSTPVLVLPSVNSFSVGSAHVCALTGSGSVECWGRNNYGKLGDGTTTDSSTPVNVSGITDATYVSAGFNHSCAVSSTGAVSCWGRNNYGQLGDNTTTNSSTPVAVSGISDGLYPFAGRDFSCVVTTSATLKCWGRNNYGQLARSTATPYSKTPVDVGLTGVAIVGGGADHVCALSSNQVYCWGANSSGQLGIGTATSTVTPTAVSLSFTPTNITAGLGSSQCSYSPSDVLSCWGDNFYGELGIGSLDTALSPMHVDGLMASTASVSVGSSAACGLFTDEKSTADGVVRCWGNNSSGQLGDGTVLKSAVPVQVSF